MGTSSLTWKRFAVNEEIDCRVNYGFTSKRRFGTSMQVQELNLENIPIIEDSADRTKCCEHLRRRVVALLMGKATWTGDPAIPLRASTSCCLRMT